MNLEKKGIPVRVICRVMDLSRASYYRGGRQKEQQLRASGMVDEADERLADTIREIQRQWPCYGVRRVWAVLRFDRGLVVNIKRVRRVMRLCGLLQNPYPILFPGENTPAKCLSASRTGCGVLT